MSKSKSFLRASTRLLVTTALLLGSFFALTKAVLADPTPPGTVIDNTATGSFEGETSGAKGTVISNTVTLTVREVAGITITSSVREATIAEAGVNAGVYQGIAGINTNDIVYFDFTITNKGNDPTKFFIPNNAQITGGTLQGNIQIIAVDPDGAPADGALDGAPGTFPPKNLAVNVTTGNDTVMLLGATGATDGYIPVNGTVTVRVPVKVTQTTAGQTVTVILGDTGANDNLDGTQNQIYSPSSTPLDVYTVDLADGTAKPGTYSAPVSQVPEADDNPANGDATGRQEASAKGSVNVVAPLTPKLLLAKRITAVNSNPIAGYIAESDPDWSTYIDTNTNYLAGAIDNVTSKPGDRIEYTIYFLVSGNKDLTNITICDLIPPNTTFVNGAYDSSVGNGSNLGIAFANDAITVPTAPTTYFTSIFDGDPGQFYPAGSLPPATCLKPNATNPPVSTDTLTAADNTNGLVVVNVVSTPTTLPHATAPRTPTNSYGFVRFQVQIK